MAKSRCYNRIKDQDMFGHAVTLNFNQQGDTYNTIIGGCASVIIKLLIFGFLVFKGYILVTRADNSFASNNRLTNFTEEK